MADIIVVDDTNDLIIVTSTTHNVKTDTSQAVSLVVEAVYIQGPPGPPTALIQAEQPTVPGPWVWWDISDPDNLTMWIEDGV